MSNNNHHANWARAVSLYGDAWANDVQFTIWMKELAFWSANIRTLNVFGDSYAPVAALQAAALSNAISWGSK